MKFDQRYFNNFFSHRIDDTYFLSLYTNSTEEYVSWVGSTNSNPITIGEFLFPENSLRCSLCTNNKIRPYCKMSLVFHHERP